jgi:hypothetical protein
MPYRMEKGNWYMDEFNWAEYAIFREGEEKPIIFFIEPEVGSFLIDRLNEEETEENWKS